MDGHAAIVLTSSFVFCANTDKITNLTVRYYFTYRPISRFSVSVYGFNNDNDKQCTYKYIDSQEKEIEKKKNRNI